MCVCLHFISLPRVCAWLGSNITAKQVTCQVPVLAFGCVCADVDRLRLGVDQCSAWRHFIWWKGSSTNRDKTSLITPPQRQAEKRRTEDRDEERRDGDRDKTVSSPHHSAGRKTANRRPGRRETRRRQGQNSLITPPQRQAEKRRQADQGGERHEGKQARDRGGGSGEGKTGRGEQAPLTPQTERHSSAHRPTQPAGQAEAPNSARAPGGRRASAEDNHGQPQADGKRGRRPGTGTGAAKTRGGRGRRAQASGAGAARPGQKNGPRRRSQRAHKRNGPGDEGGRHGRPGDAEHAQARNRGGSGDGGPISASSAAGPHKRGRRQGAHNTSDGGAHRRRRRTGTRETNNRRH